MTEYKILTPDFWITKKDELFADIPMHGYEREENERYIVWYNGILARYDGRKIAFPELAAMAFSDQLVFSDYLGWYKLVAYDKVASAWLFFGDSCGSQYLFFDRSHARFSDRLLTLRAALGSEAEPDMKALADMIGRGTLFGEETLVRGLAKTDYGSYYLFRNGVFERRSKNLPSFSEMEGKKDLTDILAPVIAAIGEKKLCAVCTGGTDSRAVLAALSSLGAEPELVITGHKDNPDLKIAAQVAASLGSELTVIDPSVRERKWLEKGLVMLDGMYDVVLSYRHYLKALWACEKGCSFEFGGFAGEFYKNAFYTPARWLFCGKRNPEFYRRFLLSAPTQDWFGSMLRDAVPRCKKTLSDIAAEAGGEKPGLLMANRIGFARLAAASGSITNGYSSACIKIDPLMDRALVAAASREGHRSHAMHMWQRRQIAKTCPRLGELPTDQGYSCSLRPLSLLAERCKRLVFFADRVFNRIRRKLGLGFKSSEQRYWDMDYVEARKDAMWQKTLTFCREKGIIRKDVKESDIPLNMTGRLMLVYMLVAPDAAKKH